MRRLLILALVLSAQAWGTIAYVGSAKQTATPSGNALTETITYTPVSGNAIYVWVYETDDAPTITVADGEGTGNSYVLLGTCIVSLAQVKGCMFRASNVSGTGAYTITATSSANSFKGLMVLEFSGVQIITPNDKVTTLAINSVTTPSLSLTTTNANDVLVSCFGDDNSATVTITPGSGYTKVQEETAGAANFVGACEYRIVASTGTYIGNWTLSTAAEAVGVHIADKEQAAAGGTVRRRVSVTVTQ